MTLSGQPLLISGYGRQNRAFNWTYVATVGLDDSYGRKGILALEKEAYNRKTFCIALYKLIHD